MPLAQIGHHITKSSGALNVLLMHFELSLAPGTAI